MHKQEYVGYDGIERMGCADMETGLNRLNLNTPARIVKIDLHRQMAERLRSFGMIPGTRVICRYRSPGKKVIAVEFRGTVVAMRARDLEKIRVRW